MYSISDWYNAIDSFAPFSTAMDFDNSGLLVGSGSIPANTALLALDLTTPVLDEATESKIPLIITHHPVIFTPVKRIPAEGLVYRLAASGVSVISAHTNLDLAKGGVNDALASCLGLKDIRGLHRDKSMPYYKLTVFVPAANAEEVYDAMSKAGAGSYGNYSGAAYFSEGEGRFLPLEGASPAIGNVNIPQRVHEYKIEMIVPPAKLREVITAMKAAHPYEEVAYDLIETHSMLDTLSLGRLGELEQQLSPVDCATLVKDKLFADRVRLVDGGRPVKTVAVCGGSGGNMLSDAVKSGAQALVTGDVKHHELLEAAELGITLIDAGHYHTEAVILEPLAKRLEELLPGAKAVISRQDSDRARFVPA